MPTKISADNLQSSLLNVIVAGGGPKITSIAVTNSSYTVLDDTAVDTAGGYIVITGTGFNTGCQVIINDVVATSTTFVNSTTVRAQVGPRAAGTYNVYLTNTDGGTAIRISGITYSALPGWVTSSTLTPGETDTFISYNLSATDATSYTLQAGSTLPPGITLSANGYLAGTVTGINDDTVYSFTIVAIDAQAQDSPRTFSVTISAGDAYINYVTALFTGDTLTANGNTFVTDASTNNFTGTPVNDTKPNRFSPFTPGYYSNFFDGNGDFLTSSASQTALSFGTGDFTIEGWIYMSGEPAVYAGFIDTRSGATGETYVFGVVNSSGLKLDFFWGGVSGSRLTSASTMLPNQWNHCAVTRTSGTLRLFINGVLDTNTATLTSAVNATSTPRIGAIADPFYFVGYISNLRVVKGTSLYTTSFTPSSTPLTAVANTSLLTCRSNRFDDASTNNFAVSRTGDVRVTSFDPFVLPSEFENLGSAFFDGSGDYVSIPDNVALRPATSDFTIEFWAYHNSVSGSQVYLGRGGVGTGGAWLVEKGSLQGWGFPVNGTSTIQTSTIAGSYAGFWFHIAVTRSGSTLRFFLDGTLMDTRTVSTDLSTTAELQIGNATQMGWSFNGWMSNLRIVKGTALYTSAFTPPTTPLTAVANTTLLTLQNNQPINNNVFVDKSSHNNVVTRIGNPTQGTFSPYGENWSHFFDGTGDYLSVANNTVLGFGTGDYTVEFWMYLTASPGSGSKYTLLDFRPSATGAPHTVYVNNSSGTLYLGFFNGTADVTTSSQPISLNTWTHCAYSRSGGTLRIYVNGVQAYSASNSIDYQSARQLTIAAGVGLAEYFTGFLSNLRIIKGTGLYTSAFTPSTTPLLPVANTSLLTCNEYNFADYSPNRLAISRFGDVAVQKFSPFTTTLLSTPYYGTYFDGAGDFLTVPASSAASFPGDFTVEFWVYLLTNSTTSPSYVLMLLPSTTYFAINMVAGSYIEAFLNAGTAAFTCTDVRPAQNAWSHIALVRSGTTVRLYVNGVASANTATNSSTLGSSTEPFYISNGTCPASHISNLRITKSAVYTSNFTPSATPLTAIANTTLLTCRSNTNIDLSNNNFAITVSGNSIPTLFSPFTPTYATKQTYSTSTLGGSMFFDGTGDYLTIGNNLNVGANNFTVQAWVHPTAWTVEWNSVISTRPTASTGGWSNVFVLGVHNSGYPYIYTGDFQVTGTANTVPLRSWTHLAVTRSGSTMRLFVNGALANSRTSLQNYTVSSGSVGANGNGSEQWTGYLSDVSLTGGQAIYTSSFVPPLSTMTPANNTLLMLNGTDAVITDASIKNDIETVGDVRLSTSIKRYGNSSIFFDGTGDYLRIPYNQNFNFGSQNFTVEFWVYFNSTATGQGIYVPYSSPFGQLTIVTNTGSTTSLRYYLGTTANTWDILTSSNIIGTVAAGTWYHVAVTRSGSNFRSFLNGVLGATATSSAALYNTNQTINIGFDPTNSQALNGYIDDFRITNGIARYTANFTPPGRLPQK